MAKDKLDQIAELLGSLDADEKVALMTRLHGDEEEPETKPKNKRRSRSKKHKAVADIPEQRKIEKPQRSKTKRKGQRVRRHADAVEQLDGVQARQEPMQIGGDRENKFLTMRNKLAPVGDEFDYKKAIKFDTSVARKTEPVERNTRDSNMCEVECNKCHDWYEVPAILVVDGKFTCNKCQTPGH